MKAANKRLLVSLGALVLSLGLTLTTTLAWFSGSNSPAATGISVNVVTQENLLISATGAEGSYANNVDLATALGTALLDHVKLAPLTPTGTAVAALAALKNYAGATRTPANSSTDGDYLEFPLYFRSPAAMNVGILTTGTSVTSTIGDLSSINTTKAYAGDYFYAGSPALAVGANIVETLVETRGPLASYATRLGFSKVTVSTNAASITSDATLEKSWVYSPNPGVGFMAVKYTKNTAHEYYAAMTGSAPDSAISVAAATTYAPTAVTGGSIGNNTIALTNGYFGADYLTTLASGRTVGGVAVFEGKIMVRLWLEGTDANCFEEILKSNIQANLQFVGTVA